MAHARMSGEEIDRRAQKLYDQSIRAIVESAANRGKVVVIDVETGGFEVDEDPMAATDRALEKHPGAALFALRIGEDAVESFGLGPASIKQ